MCFPVLMCVPGRRGRCEAIDEVGSNFGSSDANGRVNFSTHLDTFTSFIHLHTPSSSSSHTPMHNAISHFIFITKATFTSHLHSWSHSSYISYISYSCSPHFEIHLTCEAQVREDALSFAEEGQWEGLLVGLVESGTFLVKSLAARLLVSLSQANSIGLPRARRFADFPEFRICLSMKHSATVFVWISV